MLENTGLGSKKKIDNRKSNNTLARLGIFHQNIQSLPAKIESLEITLLEIGNPEIVVICEHNMRDYELDRLNLNGYSLQSYFSRTTSRGGVFLFYLIIMIII